LNDIHISRLVKCRLKMTNVHGDQEPPKWEELLKTSRTHQRRPNNPWVFRHCCDQLWSLPVLNRKSEHAPHCSFITTMRPPTRPWKPQNLQLTTWLSFPSSLLAALSPLWFCCFPNWKWNERDDNLKQGLTSEGNCKRYSTALRNITSTVLLKHGKNNGTVVYIPKETILKEMAAKIE
jgi:hypothetical protein